ncbi:hypothetical protein AB0E81_10490 [Streptomyces sp. NPDC033538]|uniref:hypothetical protein n=1 Tax=Streptomyces sp. NPDC033538 TaxID=3155367 RepID=UPI00340A9B90
MEIARIVVIGLAAAVGVLYYRRTMGGSVSRRLSRKAKALGFLPQRRQDSQRAASDPELEGAKTAASRGRWEPAAQLLARTREQRDWTRRSYYAAAFGSHEAARPDSWLDAWQSAVGPDDPDVALVRATARVSLAWHLRGGGWAKHTSREQFAGFHDVLLRAPRENARAAELNPEDPSPYVSEIWTALGLGYSHEDMRRVWDEVTDRDPYHYRAHSAALQYWCAKWRGSEELATSFAREAAVNAPLGSLLTALPLVAWYEHRDDDAQTADFRAPQVVALVDAALADVEAAPSDHPDTSAIRHLLAYFLTRQGRYDAALEQFRLVDGCVDALPWRYWDDPASVYCLWRNKALRGSGRF